MPLAIEDDIIDEIINLLYLDDCKQPFLSDDTECSKCIFPGCCCECENQIPIYFEFPISSIYCYVCRMTIHEKTYLNSTHGYCADYVHRKDTTTRNKNCTIG